MIPTQPPCSINHPDCHTDIHSYIHYYCVILTHTYTIHTCTYTWYPHTHCHVSISTYTHLHQYIYIHLHTYIYIYLYIPESACDHVCFSVFIPLTFLSFYYTSLCGLLDVLFSLSLLRKLPWLSRQSDRLLTDRSLVRSQAEAPFLLL